MSDQNEYVLRNIIKQYFGRLRILTTQIPFEVRRLLLPPYMLYLGFKSYIHIDPTGRLGFEIYRERASRYSIKMRKTKHRVEQKIFGVLGPEPMMKFNGHNIELTGGIFTRKDFVAKYGHELPKGGSKMIAVMHLTGFLEIGKKAEVKITNCRIYWMVHDKRFVKHVPFAWLFGNVNCLSRVDPFLHSESAFYFSLFGRLQEIIAKGYGDSVDKRRKTAILETYAKLIGKVEEEFRRQLAITQADEYVFQQLLTKYKFFLHPGAKIIESQPQLRKEVLRKPDFHIQLGESEHIYIEIEPPFCKPFEKTKPSRRLVGALKQISEWKKILSDQTSREESIRYMIIIGLLDDLDDEEKGTLQVFNKAQEDLRVATWDWVLEKIDRTKREMMSKLR